MTCGIYKITNTINNRCYVGQSMNIEKRKQDHFSDLKRNKHINKHLQSDFNLYNENIFKFEIIKECESIFLNRWEGRLVRKYKAFASDGGYSIGKLLDYPDDNTIEILINRVYKAFEPVSYDIYFMKNILKCGEGKINHNDLCIGINEARLSHIEKYNFELKLSDRNSLIEKIDIHKRQEELDKAMSMLNL